MILMLLKYEIEIIRKGSGGGGGGWGLPGLARRMSKKTFCENSHILLNFYRIDATCMLIFSISNLTRPGGYDNL